MTAKRHKNDSHSKRKPNHEDPAVLVDSDELDVPDEDDAPTADKGSEPEAEPTAPALNDRLLRLQADFDNYRKRMVREKADIYRRANEDIMEEILPVLDHLELALAAVGDSAQHDSIAKGFKLVGEQLFSTLSKFGLSPVDTDGVTFDPNLHEAVLHMPSDEVPENGIVSKTRAGYMLGGQLLRAAQVVVSSGAPTQVVEESGETDGPDGPGA